MTLLAVVFKRIFINRMLAMLVQVSYDTHVRSVNGHIGVS